MAVYEPAEDSELLMKHIDFSGLDVLDMGTGSGILALKALEKGNRVTAADINPEAVEMLGQHAGKMRLVLSDLFQNVEGEFDVILFNAPYLPSEVDQEYHSKYLAKYEKEIWDGGPSGREVIERFAGQFRDHLKKNGRALMVISSLTGEKEALKLFSDYDAKVIDRMKIPWEELLLIEIKRRRI